MKISSRGGGGVLARCGMVGYGGWELRMDTTLSREASEDLCGSENAVG